MSLNALATLGFLLTAIPELTGFVDFGTSWIVHCVVVLLIFALLWWQYSKDSVWATWILGLLTSAGAMTSIGLGITLWVVLVVFSVGHPAQPDEVTVGALAIFRSLSYVAAFAIVIIGARSRASRNANTPARSEGAGG